MANWLVRSPLRFVESTSPRDMEKAYGGSFVDSNGKAVTNPTAVLNPNMLAVQGQPEKYWELAGDILTLVDQAARDVIDIAELSARRDEIADDIDRVETYTRAFALVVLDEINNLRVNAGLTARTVAQLKTAVRNKLNG